MHPDLHVFVRDALSRGTSREAIRAALKEARWADDEIEAALDAWHDAGLGVPVPRRRVAFSAREAFLYLLMFVALYMVAYHTGAILFGVVERKWPDVAFDDRVWDRTREWVRFGVASLLVAFPVYLFTSRITGRAIAADPEKRNSGVRRWLTYLTLFNAACVLIGDFIVVLLGLLKGELTARFLSKAAIVAAIAGWLFTHYLGGLRRDESDAPRVVAPSRLARVAGVAVVLVTLWGLWLAGAPAAVRRQTLDQRRVRELSEISNALQHHYRVHRALPLQLHTLDTSNMPGAEHWNDPVTGVPYDYRVVDSTRYELCATFETADSLGPWGDKPHRFWKHGVGKQCFTFEVTKYSPSP